jgi:tripartite ATP-independent transporter DctM subunit
VTPTESAAIAVAVAIIVGGFFYRELKFSDLAGILDRTAANTATVLFLIVAAKLFGWVLTFNQVPQATAGFLQSLTDNPILFMLLVFLILNVVGMFLDGIAALIILVPILLPIATGAYGIDPVHFGIMMCLTLILGLLTPPVGAGLFIASSINGIGVVTLSRLLLPFIAMTAVVILAVIAFPVLTRPFG